MENVTNNKVFIAGVVESPIEFSHEVFGEKFYEFNLKVKRLSGYCDLVPVTISERFNAEQLQVGQTFACRGQFRSYNKLFNDKSKLMLTVFVRELEVYREDDNPNHLEITGYVCKPPVYRTTPFRREICDVLIAVNRGYNKSDYLPCIAWGKNAAEAKDWQVGDKVKLSGRIQSRVYQKRIAENEVCERVAYEISISKLEKTHDLQNEQEEQVYYANME